MPPRLGQDRSPRRRVKQASSSRQILEPFVYALFACLRVCKSTMERQAPLSVSIRDAGEKYECDTVAKLRPHLQTSDRVRIRQRQLLGETLATTPCRRQERDFLPQRLRPEIGRVPFRRTRDSKDALEKPAVSGHFRRVSTCRQKT